MRPSRKAFKLTSGNGSPIQPDELERALVAEDYDQYLWFDLVRRVVDGTNHIAAARAWLEEQHLAQTQDRMDQPQGGWTKNQERDRVIRNCVSRGLAPERICEELDKRTIATLPALQVKSIHRWADGWKDGKARNAIQLVFSKVLKREKRTGAS